MIGLLIPNFYSFMIFRTTGGLSAGLLAPTLVALVSDKKKQIGGFSSFGALGWAVGVLISGILGLFWLESIFIFGMLALAGALIVAFKIEDVFSENPQNLTDESVLEVFWGRKAAYLSLGIRHSFANAIWVYWSLFLSDLGANTFWIAIIQFMNAFTQFVIMQKYTDKLKSESMIILGLFLSALAFWLFTLPTDFWGIIPSQIVLGLSWAFLYVGTLRYSVEKSDHDKSTSSGILTSTQAISGIFGPIIALILISFGGTYTDIMLVATLATVITFIGFLIFKNNNKSEIRALN